MLFSSFATPLLTRSAIELGSHHEKQGEHSITVQELGLWPVQHIVVEGNNRTSAGEPENVRNRGCPSQSCQCHHNGMKRMPEKVQPWLQPQHF